MAVGHLILRGIIFACFLLFMELSQWKTEDFGADHVGFGHKNKTETDKDESGQLVDNLGL